MNEFRFNYFREGQQTTEPSGEYPGQRSGFLRGSRSAPRIASPTRRIPRSGSPPIFPGTWACRLSTFPADSRIGNNFEGELPQTGNTFQWTDNFTKTLRQAHEQIRRGRPPSALRSVSVLQRERRIHLHSQHGGTKSGRTATFPRIQIIFLARRTSYSQGAAQGENVRNTALYLFAQDSWKIKPNLTLNYGLRWELNTPYYDTGNRLQTFRPGQVTTQYPCWISADNAAAFGTTLQAIAVRTPANGKTRYFRSA